MSHQNAVVRDTAFPFSIEAKILGNEPISRSDANYLWHEAPLGEVARLAHIRRNMWHPTDRATYLIDRNINYTNVCNTDCSFCGFYRHDPRHPESYVLSRETIAAKIREALDLGATRILLQGGHNDELPYDFYVGLISWIHQEFKIQLNAFSPSEICQMRKVSGKSLREILSDLKDAGMDGLPGGGAEILDDEIRKRVSPKKIGASEWIEVMEVAQSLDLVTTATMVIGFGESLDHRLNHFDQLRELQKRSNEAGRKGFNAFISWPLQHNENTSLGRSRFRDSYGASTVEYLKHLALSRIYLHNIPHHQSSWPTAGGTIAQIGLHFGCDDVGSTMMEENVVSKAGAPTKTKWSMSPEELRDIIRSAGYRPAQRDSYFTIVEES